MHFSNDLDMNLFNVVTLPIHLWTFLIQVGWGISRMACTFSRLDSIFRVLTMYAKYSDEESAFHRIEFHLILVEHRKNFFQVFHMLLKRLTFYYHVIFIYLRISTLFF